ncbi:hypothetical protein [Streptomyces sp. Wb2n-11]|nr:hypothetical protein [Streptomyces sp. Wb2n-11]
MLPRSIDFITGSNGSTAGFNIVTATNHSEVHVWEHRLADGTTT